jgi:hypothetical protein
MPAVPFENGEPAEPPAVIYRPSRTLSPAMKSFIALLKRPVATVN